MNIWNVSQKSVELLTNSVGELVGMFLSFTLNARHLWEGWRLNLSQENMGLLQAFKQEQGHS